jgi:hypothetical protein
MEQQPATADLHRDEGSTPFPVVYRPYWINTKSHQQYRDRDGKANNAAEAWRRYTMGTLFCWADGIDSWSSYGSASISLCWSTDVEDTENDMLIRQRLHRESFNNNNPADETPINMEVLAFDDQGGVGLGFDGSMEYPAPIPPQLRLTTNGGSEEETITLAVLMMDGSSMALDLPFNATTLAAKDAISAKIGIPAIQQSLSEVDGSAFLRNSELIGAERKMCSLLISDPNVWRICTVQDANADSIKIGYRVGSEEVTEWVDRNSLRFNPPARGRAQRTLLS